MCAVFFVTLGLLAVGGVTPMILVTLPRIAATGGFWEDMRTVEFALMQIGVYIGVLTVAHVAGELADGNLISNYDATMFAAGVACGAYSLMRVFEPPFAEKKSSSSNPF